MMFHSVIGLVLIGIGIISYKQVQWVKKALEPLVGFFKKNRIFFLGVMGVFILLYILDKFGNDILFYSYAIFEIFRAHSSFILSWIFLSFAYVFITKFTDGLSENGYTKQSEKNKNNERYELATFNDAIVRELMELRSGITSIQIAQDRQMIKQRGRGMSPLDLDFPDEFIKLYRMYMGYPDKAFCHPYKTPSGRRAGIIILFDDDVEFDSPYQFDVETLRKLHSSKRRGHIIEGDTIYVHIFDPDDIDERFMAKSRRAKVLAIKNVGYDFDCVIKLEITMWSKYDYYDYLECGNEPDETIIKEITIGHHQVNAWRFKCSL